MKWEQLPVYLVAEFLAGAAAALAYGFIAHTPADRAVSEGIDLADPVPVGHLGHGLSSDTHIQRETS